MFNILYLFFPIVAGAQTPPIPPSVKAFVGKISTEILNPLIALMFAVALMYFFYGIAAYIWNPDNEDAREKGRIGMLWGIVGMFVMVSVFGIMWFIIRSIGADQALMSNV
jgi:hypothetical protein